MEGTGLKKKDLKRFREILLAKKKEILRNAQRTLNEDMTLDADDLPDEMDLASSEYLHSFTFRLRGREKVFLQKIDHALEKIRRGDVRGVRAVRRADLDQAARGAPGNDPVHPLQGRPGTDRKGVRLSVRAAARLAAGFVWVGLAGCAGPLAFEQGSASLGTHADGTLRHPAMLPVEGDGYSVPRRGACAAPTTRPRSSWARSCARRAPWSATLREARRQSAISRAGAGRVGRAPVAPERARRGRLLLRRRSRRGVPCGPGTRCCTSPPTAAPCGGPRPRACGRRRPRCRRRASMRGATGRSSARCSAIRRSRCSRSSFSGRWRRRCCARRRWRATTRRWWRARRSSCASRATRTSRRPHARPAVLRAERSVARLRRQGAGALVEEDVEVHGRAVRASARSTCWARTGWRSSGGCSAASCRRASRGSVDRDAAEPRRQRPPSGLLSGRTGVSSARWPSTHSYGPVAPAS